MSQSAAHVGAISSPTGHDVRRCGAAPASSTAHGPLGSLGVSAAADRPIVVTADNDATVLPIASNGRSDGSPALVIPSCQHQHKHKHKKNSTSLFVGRHAAHFLCRSHHNRKRSRVAGGNRSLQHTLCHRLLAQSPFLGQWLHPGATILAPGWPMHPRCASRC